MSDYIAGPAIIIDDEIGVKGASINELLDQIKERGIPFVERRDLNFDFEKFINHLEGVSFLVFDWNLQPPGTKGLELTDDIINQNIEFLKLIHEKAFFPVFIFTSFPLKEIKEKLSENGLYEENKNNLIFVKSKKDLLDGNLFKEIEIWILSNPLVYVLKEWEREYKAAKNSLFQDFYKKSNSWPEVIWETYEADDVDPASGLGEVITRNLHSRMSPFQFKKEYLSHDDEAEPDEIRNVLGGERFILQERLAENSIASGDFFKFSGKFYLNIRPDCDCIVRENDSIDELELYLLKASKLTPSQEAKCFKYDYENFSESDEETIIFSLFDNRTFSIHFKELEKRKWEDLKNKRVGRLLPPYITRVQQRYSHYLQRQGLPRIPKKLFPKAEEPPSDP